MSVIEVRVPDMGDSKGVTVLELLIVKGARVNVDDPLITLETEKASMDVPSPVAGTVESIDISKGDAVVAGYAHRNRDRGRGYGQWSGHCGWDGRCRGDGRGRRCQHRRGSGCRHGHRYRALALALAKGDTCAAGRPG